MSKGTVAVGLSGGVDSAVSAYLLKNQGYEVFGLFMRNWADDEQCNASDDFKDVERVCQILDIPYYTVDFCKDYWDRVFKEFLDRLKEGVTPNPDVLCNREIKFSALYQRAKTLGADYLATGHYCQTKTGKLLRGHDPNKDQSYFLYMVKAAVLKDVLFPLGGLEKPMVRKIAEEAGLPVHDKRDSTGICFIGKRPFREFVKKYIPMKPGPFIDTNGKPLGEHEGAFYYTIGQRKGLGIGGPGDAWFVVDKDIDTNTVTLAQGENHEALFHTSLEAKELTWVDSPPKLPIKCSAKVRYRQTDVPCTITQTNKGITVNFESPMRAITPGQSVVFYDKNTCLGGAIIYGRSK
ncbi:MAG: tRNA-specific 2-thiouridylase MnmA [Chlamydiia bacterium]|nr:tRNA-specific 2-thiouridylase MnmA [Chlamydiia bacterium]MCH9615699.1 tRNA-specific 2-thiouridylase MnmA [Chlamydiia bacterium]MCH9628898.1 tRNA-specific 2-thiouridylase MnmA [Chlamydiia bacterium]